MDVTKDSKYFFLLLFVSMSVLLVLYNQSEAYEFNNIGKVKLTGNALFANSFENAPIMIQQEGQALPYNRGDSTRLNDRSNTVNNRGRNLNFQEREILPESLNKDIEENVTSYIVELKGEPLVVEEVKLKEIAKANEQKIAAMGRYNPLKIGYKIFGATSDKIPEKIKEREESLKEQRQDSKEDIKRALRKDNIQNSLTGNVIADSKTLVVLSEFDTVFNGLTLKVTKNEAEKIKKIPEVKAVHPNRKASINLMDSVPLIGADKVWELDADGNSCKTTGKECITGKGVKIGIIDTGVDYMHPDLGCTSKTDCNPISPYELFHPRIYGSLVVWLDQREGNDVYMYDLSTGREKLITDTSSGLSGNCKNVFGSGFMPFVYPDVFGDKIVYNDCNDTLVKIYMYDTTSGTEKIITDKAYHLAYPRIDGQRITWTDFRNGNNDIYLYDLSTGKEKQVTNDIYDQRYSDINGNIIVWSDYRDGISGIYMHDISKGETKKITKDGAVPDIPTTNGKQVVWRDMASSKIYMYNITTGQETQIKTNPYGVNEVEIYDNKVVWREYRWQGTDYWWDVYAYDISTGVERQVTSDNYKQFDPHIYENKIVYEGRLGHTDTAWEIFIYDLATSQETQITTSHVTNLDGSFPNSKVIGGYDFVNYDEDPMDDNGHGTHVAATAAGNGILKGVAPDASIYAYKVCDLIGTCYWDAILSAIERSVDPNQDGNLDDHLDVISLSLGGYGNPDDPLSRAIDNTVTRGVIAVVAAGNSGPYYNTVGSPGTSRKALTVGAVNTNKAVPFFSSIGPVRWEDEELKIYTLGKPDIVAPGVNICAAEWSDWLSSKRCIDDNHISISGTSMATPHVSGAAALIKQVHPDWTPEQLKAALKDTAEELPFSPVIQGNGLINAKKAVFQNTPPVAELGQILENGNIRQIKSRISYTDLKELRISYTSFRGLFISNSSFVAENTPADWKVLSVQNNVPKGDFLFELNTDIIPDGYYILKLELSEQDGQKAVSYGYFNVDNIDIISPLNNDIYRAGDIVPLQITTRYLNPPTVNWEFGIGKSPTQFFPIPINRLSNWDTTGLHTGFYTARFIINSGSAVTILNKTIYLDETLKKGWPKRITMQRCEPEKGDDCGRSLYWGGGVAEPIVADLDGDTKQEVIVYQGGVYPRIFVYNPDGSLKWDLNVGSRNSWNGEGDNKLIVADLEEDGKKEIIAVRQPSLPGRGEWGEVHVFDYKGMILKGFPTRLDSVGSTITLSASDINNDNRKEIVVFTESSVYIISSIGSVINRWDIPLTGWQDFSRTPAIGNLDSDPELEIVIAGPSADSMSIIGEKDGMPIYKSEGQLDVFNLDGTEVTGWPRKLPSEIIDSPAIADLNNDGKNEIIVALFAIPFENDPDSKIKGGIYAFRNDGSIYPGWPQGLGNRYYASPAIGDINNDGFPEIAISREGDFEPSPDTEFGKIVGSQTEVYSNDGKVMAGWPQPTSLNDLSSVIIGDIDGDKIPDLATAAGAIDSETGVYAWTNRGKTIQGFPKIVEVDPYAAPTIADLDNDGKLEIIASSRFDSESLWETKNRVSIYAWELPANIEPSTMHWPTFHHDNQRTGLYGAFDKALLCEDSDGGDNIYQKGTVNGPLLTTGQQPQDYCSPSDANILVEYSCSREPDFFDGAVPGLYSKSVKCPYGCKDGACTKAPSDCYTLATYPSIFYGKDGNFDGSIVVGDFASAEIIITATDILYSLGLQQASKLASEISNIKLINSILIGNACNNAAIAQALGSPQDCTQDLTPGIGTITIMKHSTGKIAVIVSGYSDLDFRNAGQALAKYKTYLQNSQATAVSVKKAYDKLTVTDSGYCTAQKICTDSDGGLNYYTKGSGSTISGSTDDNCDTVFTLVEYQCNPDLGGFTATCINGCKDGACVPQDVTDPIEGCLVATSHKITITTFSSNQYNLKFADGRGNNATLPLAFAHSKDRIKLGNAVNDLVVQEGKIISKDDYFIVTDYSDANGQRQSFALRYRGADKVTAENPVLRFDDLGSGESIERSITATDNYLGQIKLGGGGFNVYSASSHLVDDYDLQIDLNGNGFLEFNNYTQTFVIANPNTIDGAEIEFGAITPFTLDLTIHNPLQNPSNLESNKHFYRIYSIGDEVRFDEKQCSAVDCPKKCGLSTPSEIIIDNNKTGTSATGAWCKSGSSGFYGTDSLYSCGNGIDVYKWNPGLKSTDYYGVSMWWTAHTNRAKNGIVKIISGDGGMKTFVVNEQTNGSRWNSFGIFNLGPNSFVETNDQNGQVVADAVKFTKAWVKVVAPNTGGYLEIGTAYAIKWDSYGLDKINIDLLSYPKGTGKNYQISSLYPASAKEFLWTIPNNVAEGSYVISIGYSGLSDTSDDYFKIINSTKLMSPALKTDKVVYTKGETIKFFAKVLQTDGTSFTPEEGAIVALNLMPPNSLTGFWAELEYNSSSESYKFDKIISDTDKIGLWTAYINVVSKLNRSLIIAASDKITFQINEKSNCTDSDKSPDYTKYAVINPTIEKNPDLFVKGYSNGLPEGYYLDICPSSTHLNEAFCTENGLQSSYGVICPYGCRDGACVQQISCGNGICEITDSTLSCPSDCKNVKEKLTCVFKDAIKAEKCWFDVKWKGNTYPFECAGYGSCIINVSVNDVTINELIERPILNSCGDTNQNMNIIVLDGQDEIKTFNCRPTEIIIDNNKTGTSATGTWCKSGSSGFYGTDSLYSCGSGLEVYVWSPGLITKDNYEVFAWWTAHTNRATKVPIKVIAADGNARTFTVNQQVNGSRWNSLGMHTLGSNSFVETNDQNGQVAADAVKFVKVSPSGSMITGEAIKNIPIILG